MGSIWICDFLSSFLKFLISASEFLLCADRIGRSFFSLNKSLFILGSPCLGTSRPSKADLRPDSFCARSTRRRRITTLLATDRYALVAWVSFDVDINRCICLFLLVIGPWFDLVCHSYCAGGCRSPRSHWWCQPAGVYGAPQEAGRVECHIRPSPSCTHRV